MLNEKLPRRLEGVVNSTSLRYRVFIAFRLHGKANRHKVLVAFCSKDKPDSEEILVIEPAKLADFLEEEIRHIPSAPVVF